MTEFTEEDRAFLEYAINHNLGVRLSEAVRHLIDAYDAIRPGVEQQFPTT